jgi:carbamoyl-phosphate synthase large subunit
MPKRTDIHKILVIGSGPIVIGQGCEFDYSGAQACKALRVEGFEIALINSNPATIMTDPEFADRTYIEPLTVEAVCACIERERPDALLPTVGGQTALNLAVALAEEGVLERFGVEIIGAKLDAIKIAEDRLRFKLAMEELGLHTPRSVYVRSLDEARAAAKTVGYPAIIRPSFTLGGAGGGIAYKADEYEKIVANALFTSPVHEALIEESLIGWKEFEIELMRDPADNVVIICSIENFDPMGVHTGDSITVAPAQTLTDREYQVMRDAAIQVIRKVGVETGGSNIQFALNPSNGDLAVIEMNPRVSRSSALASKATGFPIAKLAAKLAAGYTLDELPNDITRKTVACFEPTIDYCVVKIPKWAFEKFPGSDTTLGTQMKSVGEVMAIGRTFKEAFQKGMRSLESSGKERIHDELTRTDLVARLRTPTPERVHFVMHALRLDYSIEELHELTKIDPWFLDNLREITAREREFERESIETITRDALLDAKRLGFSDQRLAALLSTTEDEARALRRRTGVRPVFQLVDTCGAEFESFTPYLYSTYEDEDEANTTDGKKIIILGSGPNRIGQGIEFDYCCCHAAFALREEGYETIMVNCNPETVSTDYDTSDRLYFEPITFEYVMEIVEIERPAGVIVQFGGQTPLNLATRLFRSGAPVIGTAPSSIDLAEDRERFGRLLADLKIPQPPNGYARSEEEACEVASRIGYPVLARPSYVLGGRAMKVVYSEAALKTYMASAFKASPDHAVLIDSFLEGACEIDVDALADGERVVIAGIQRHIEEAGIHSGDSSSVLPPYGIREEHLNAMRRYTRALAAALGVVGLMNIQFAISGDTVYALEVNPRASRTVPFVSKATGVPLAKIAAKLMIGRRLADFDLPEELTVDRFFIKSPVFPFVKFPGVDPMLGPEMRSTGEVMGVAEDFGDAYLRAQQGAGVRFPTEGTVLIDVNERDQHAVVDLAREIQRLGFRLVAGPETQRRIARANLHCDFVYKASEGSPNSVDLIRDRKVDLVITTPSGDASSTDDRAVRIAAIQYGVPLITTMTAARATVAAIRALKEGKFEVRSLQEYHERAARRNVAPLKRKLISQPEAFTLTGGRSSSRTADDGRVTLAQALCHLPELNQRRIVSAFKYGTMAAEILAPPSKSPLHPHSRDEIYIVARGTGELFRDRVALTISPGDFLFVPAGMEHHFRNFADDLVIWAVYYGPDGGEVNSKKSNEGPDNVGRKLKPMDSNREGTLAQVSRNGKVTISQALGQLPGPNGERFIPVFNHGTLVVEILAPPSPTPLPPHTRDEVYIVVQGTGELIKDGVRMPVGPGDFLFVPAGVEHNFENFTDDLTIWTIFYGPEGGEADEDR